jgi:large subunit ribosomal protein L21
LYVDRLEGNDGDKITFDKVLLLDNGGKVTVGAPTTGTSVSATILGQSRADKVIVFKKKRRKGYKVKNGHRQTFTKVKIDSI